MKNPPGPPTKKEEKTYPSVPDAEGYYFKSKEEEANGILTRDYENGSVVKKVVLSTGQSAIIRKLKGRDFVETKRRIQSDNTQDAETIGLAIATEIDGQAKPMEYYLDDLYQGDYLRLFVAYGDINL